MQLKIRDGVLTVSEKHGDTIEIAVVDGELEVYGNVAIEEVESEEEEEEEIVFPDEPEKVDKFAHLVDRTEQYPLIEGLKKGDRVRLRLDLDEDLDEVENIGLAYKWIRRELSRRDLIVGSVRSSDTDGDIIYIERWYLSTRWVTKVEEEINETSNKV